MEEEGDEEGEEQWDQIWNQGEQDYVAAAGSNTGGLDRMALNDNKAGMGNLDKERINKVIYEMSKGSKYYENEQRKEEQVKAKIAAQHKQIQSFDAREIEKSELQADAMLAAIEEMRDFSRTIVHIDMDAFYAAVEMRDNPSLKNIPMAVGGSAMLSTSNYEARRFGVRAAMPGFIAKKLCPDLVIVPTNFDKYRQVSKDVKEILLQYDPNMCPMSLDEAYLDITQHLAERKNFDAEQKTFRTADGEQRMFGVDAEDVVQEIRFRIEVKTQLTASAGIAPNMMLAKVCSDFNKPNGQYLIPFNRQAVMDFVKDLPVRKVCGIGRVSCSMLGAMGVVTCSDLFRKRGLLLKLYSAISFNYFLRVSAGVGSTSVQRGDDRKSMSTERTFAEINRPAELFAKCYELCEALVEDLKKENLKGKTITLKIKTIKYIVRTKAHSLLNATQDVQLLYSTARDLLRTEIRLCSPEPLRLRLMGVRMSNLSPASKSSDTQITIHQMLKKSRGEQKLPFGAVVSGADRFLSFMEQKDPYVDEDLPGANAFPDEVPRTSTEKENTEFICPVCDEHPEDCVDLRTFNEHIDLCLFHTNDEKKEEKVEEKGEDFAFKCPVCCVVLKSPLDSFNAHVDACLNRSAIKEILSEESLSTPRKRSSGASPFPAKKPKTDGCHTLLNYFKSPK